MKIYFLRHGVTEWNTTKKLQGQTDIALSEFGVSQVQRWTVPKGIQQWYVSPLIRARQTANLLGLADYIVCPELTEMDWGEWEGMTIQQLRNAAPIAMTENENRGLDMFPPGGETPRDVAQRLGQWSKTLVHKKDIGAITHKGVIRAALSLATGWDMKSKPPIKIKPDTAYLFETAETGLNYMRMVALI